MTIRTLSLFLFAILTTGAAGQQLRYEDVVRNLRNPDPKARMSALELLREARHLEAITPIAPLINDPVDAIQLAAIETQLAFHLVEDISARKRVALVVEVRNSGRAEAAFASGLLAAWPREVPAELVSNLLKAVDDEHPRVRIEAIFTLGTIARPPLAGEHVPQLVAALDHYDPAVRTAAARVIGRLGVTEAGETLIKAVNDSQPPVRFAAMRALGEIREERAVQALTQQLEYYRKGEGAWSALDGLARIAHGSSVPLFTARLADRDPYFRRAAAEGLGRAMTEAEAAALEAALKDSSEMVRAAAAFGLQKLGRDAVPTLVAFFGSARMAPQIGEYFLELGPSVAPQLVPHLKDARESIRGNVAIILGALGSEADIDVLQPLLHDRNRDVVRSAERAIQRIKMRQTRGS